MSVDQSPGPPVDLRPWLFEPPATLGLKESGLTQPDRVRLLKVQKIPTPSHPSLVTAGEAASLISSCTIGLTLRYGIFVRNDHRDQRRLIVHELAHTMQYKWLGSIEAFLRQYWHECIRHRIPGFADNEPFDIVFRLWYRVTG